MSDLHDENDAAQASPSVAPANASSLRTSDELINVVRLKRNGMPNRLRIIADFLIDRSREAAMLSTPELADIMGVAPSALVRFAKALGFSGFAPMQRILKEGIAREAPAAYGKRLEGLRPPGDPSVPSINFVFEAFFAANIQAMERYRANADLAAIDRVVIALKSARLIAVMGQKRAFPLAAYLFYGLARLMRQVVLIDALGGMAESQIAMLRDGDIFLAISFSPYAEGVMAAAALAREKGAQIVAITDRPDSPPARLAELVICVEDSNISEIRSISVTSTVVQAIFVSLGMELNRKAPR